MNVADGEYLPIGRVDLSLGSVAIWADEGEVRLSGGDWVAMTAAQARELAAKLCEAASVLEAATEHGEAT